MHSLSLKVHFCNIRGVHSNLNEVHHHLETEAPHLLFLTETQIKDPLDQAYLRYPGYNLESKFHPRAGVCLYVRDKICCLRLRDLEVSDFSVLWVLVDTGTDQTIYACVYRSHSGDREATRLTNYLSDAAEKVQQRYPSAQLVFLGDFNAHHGEWLYPYQDTDHAGRETYKFSVTYGLSQLVQEPTRIPDVAGHTAYCLDLLLTTDPDRYTVSVSPPLGTSDHCLVKSVSHHSPPDFSPKGTRRVWRYKSAEWDEMRNFYASYPWRQVCFTSNDPSRCADAISSVILQGMEYFIPFADISLETKARPWFNAECIRAEKLKHEAYLAWADARRSKAVDLQSLKKAYNTAAKSSKKVFRRARFDHIGRIGDRLAKYPSGCKAFWSLAKSVEENFCRPSLPPLRKSNGALAHTAREKADLFANLFAEYSRLDSNGKIPPQIPPLGPKMRPIHIYQKEVLKCLQKLDVNKASGPDGIPAIVLKHCAAELSPVLTRLFRLSLETGKVPSSWKVANVQPVPKKGSRADPANYRPVAITSVICKIMERVLNRRLLAYLETNELLSDDQYGFRSGRSTGDLLVYATHLWSEALEGHGEAIAVSLDISKAFDRVWHEALLNKLPAYGLPPEFCSWVSDFLRERSIRVVLDGYSSDLVAINAGVPQGSVLSATLFLLHINDLFTDGLIGYADDSTIVDRYISNARASSVEIQNLRESMIGRVDLTLRRVSNWGDTNLVKFNPSKTQACIFSAKKRAFDLTPTFQNVSLPLCNHFNLLGITVTPKLNFGQQIEFMALTASKKLGILSKVRRYFTSAQLLRLYTAQVRSCMEYCSHLWDGSAKYQLEALNSVDRRARRIINDDLLTSNHLQPLEHRRMVASLSVFYRIHFGECSKALFELIEPSPFHHRSTRRRQAFHPYIVGTPKNRTKRFDKSFLTRTSKVWNELPASIFPESYSPQTFKSRVNGYLMDKRVTSSSSSSLSIR